MEGDHGGAQSLQDIENYLANFNKEISAVDGATYMYGHPDAEMVVADQLYTATTGMVYQSSTIDGMGAMHLKLEGASTQNVEPGGDGQQQTYSVQEIGGPGGEMSFTDSVMASCTAVTAGAMVADDGTLVAQQQHNQQTGVSSGGSFQTVTIVPSEVNQSGEVSYVLIVSQEGGDNDGKGPDGNDMSVFDFKEEAMAGDSMDEDEEPDGPPRERGQQTSTSRSGGRAVQVASSVPMQMMCNYCNYTSPKRFLLMRHMRAHSTERPHRCKICGHAFKTTTSLQHHVNTHGGIRPNRCKECESAFTTSGELVRHVRYRHTLEKPHKCTDCDYSSVELSKLKRHIRSHTGERPYACPHCMYASPDTFKLKRHLRTHTGEKPYVCDICGLRFTQSNSLKSHKLIHTGNKPVFQCELCPTTCGRKTDLKNHVIKIHTSEQPLHCKKCGKAFPDRYTYRIHLRTHDGEKCFRCELCPYSSLMQRHLESHILTHTGEKPFQCEQCDQSFRQKQLLRRHVNIYHNPHYVAPPARAKLHQCTECDKTFAHRGNLLRHFTYHDPDNVEYQQAVENGEDASTGEEEEAAPNNENGEQEYDENGDSQTMQVQLLQVRGQEGEEVYIQIDSHQLGLLQQQAAEYEPSVLEQQDDDDIHEVDQSLDDQMDEPESGLMATPLAKRGRGRPRKTPLPSSDQSGSQSPRSYGRRVGRPAKMQMKIEVGSDESDDEASKHSTPRRRVGLESTPVKRIK